MTDEPLDLREVVGRERRLAWSHIHRWFAVRPPSVARASVALTLARSAQGAEGLDEEGVPTLLRGVDVADRQRSRVLDLFSGTASIAGAAAKLGCDADAVELNPVAHLIARCTWVHGAEHSEPDEEWRGIAAEYSDVATRLWESAEREMQHHFDPAHKAYVWVRVTACPQCGADVDMDEPTSVARNLGEPGRPPGWQRGVACTSCGDEVELSLQRRRQSLIALRAIVDAQGNAVATVDEPPSEPPAPSVEAWAADPEVGTPRQAAFMLALVDAVKRLNVDLRTRGLHDERRRALVECAAVHVSALAEFAGGHGRLDRQGRYSTGGPLGRRMPRAFVEPGLALWRNAWQRRLNSFAAPIEAAARMTGTVRPHVADASRLPFDDGVFDAVVCDPPYFDNIQYADESEPHYHWLRLMLGPEAPFSATAPPRSGEIVVKRGAEKAATLDQYHVLLRRSMEEAARVLRPGRCLSVLCNPRDAEGLDDFLRRIAPQGLELVEVVPIRTEPSTIAVRSSERLTYLLMLRKSLAVRPAGPPTVDAFRVLDLADEGKPHLFGAIATILDEEWDDEDLRRIPSNYVGSRFQKIMEYAAGVTDPAELLSDIGPRALRRHADALGLRKDARPVDTLGLATEVLRLVGFTVPAPPAFTFSYQLDIARRAGEALRLSSDMETLRGRFKTGAEAIEVAVRAAARAWVRAAFAGDPDELFARLFREARDIKPYRGTGAFSFGDWVAIFGGIAPALLPGASSQLHPGLSNLRKALTKGKAQQKLDAHVGGRNDIEHPDDEYLALSFEKKVEAATHAMGAGVEALSRLISVKALPQVLQPLEERRDAWGRRTLHALDEAGVRREFYVTAEIDLTKPWLWFPTGGNPREVTPFLLAFSEMEATGAA